MRDFFRGALFFVLVAGIIVLPTALRASVTEMTGSKLRWGKGPISIHLSSSFSSPTSGIPAGSDVLGALQRSLAKWEDIADIEFKLSRSEDLSVSPSGATGDGISLITIAPVAENALLFTKDRAKASAITRVFFDRQGRITEGDIVLNPAFQFSTDNTFGTYDLEAVFTHEIGHLLGLGHSNIGSSVMFDGVPLNNFFEAGKHLKALSDHDIASIRGLYGAGISDPDCCGVLQGQFPVSGSKLKDVLIWAQDRKTGAVTHAGGASKNGSFELNGITLGAYDILAQANDDTGAALGSVWLGGGAIDFGINKLSGKPSGFAPVGFRIEAIGIEDQLSRRAVSVERGHNYRLLVGGKGLDMKGLSFGTTSPLILLKPGSEGVQYFEGGLLVVALDVSVDNSVPTGEYSLFVESPVGLRRYFVGAISVE
jgi:hypothetical protein